MLPVKFVKYKWVEVTSKFKNDNDFLFSGVVLDGVILEGAFATVRQPIKDHPFTWVAKSNFWY